MSNFIQLIDFTNLALAFFPVLAVVGILYKWSLDYKNALYAISRMLIQLLLIGYVLVYIFETDNPLAVFAVLGVMISASAWISLRTINVQRRRPGVASRNDDRADFVRNFSVDSRQISDHGHVHGVQFCRNFCGLFSCLYEVGNRCRWNLMLNIIQLFNTLYYYQKLFSRILPVNT